MVWLGICPKNAMPLVILDERAVNHTICIEKVLPVALKYGNEIFDSDSVFQQCGTRPHSHHLTEQWCRDNFPSFLDRDHWSPKSPDLNHLDYSIWGELVYTINWDKAKSKTTLIQQLKLSHKNIHESFVFESCTS